MRAIKDGKGYRRAELTVRTGCSGRSWRYSMDVEHFEDLRSNEAVRASCTAGLHWLRAALLELTERRLDGLCPFGCCLAAHQLRWTRRKPCYERSRLGVLSPLPAPRSSISISVPIVMQCIGPRPSFLAGA
jgi:hypothetical protein